MWVCVYAAAVLLLLRTRAPSASANNCNLPCTVQRTPGIHGNATITPTLVKRPSMPLMHCSVIASAAYYYFAGSRTQASMMQVCTVSQWVITVTSLPFKTRANSAGGEQQCAELELAQELLYRKPTIAAKWQPSKWQPCQLEDGHRVKFYRDQPSKWPAIYKSQTDIMQN